jgi:hypothetical protein
MAELLSSSRRQFRPPFSNRRVRGERGGDGEAHHRLTFAGRCLYGEVDRAPSGEAHGAGESVGGRESWEQVEELGELVMAKESSSASPFIGRRRDVGRRALLLAINGATGAETTGALTARAARRQSRRGEGPRRWAARQAAGWQGKVTSRGRGIARRGERRDARGQLVRAWRSRASSGRRGTTRASGAG